MTVSSNSSTAIRALMERAIADFGGSEKRLGASIGFSQNAVWAAKRRGSVSPKMAKSIDRLSKGKIPAASLCPDVFAPVSGQSNPSSDDTSDREAESSSGPNPETGESPVVDRRVAATHGPALPASSANIVFSSEQPFSPDREKTRV